MRTLLICFLSLSALAVAQEPKTDPLGLDSRPFQKSKTIDQAVKDQKKDGWQFAAPEVKPKEPLGAVSAPKGTDPLKATSSPKEANTLNATSAAPWEDPLNLKGKAFNKQRSQFDVQRQQRSPVGP
ncbi:MAG: hypothetical protein KIS61_33095 [Candidatus Eremiobacteraeota bacterium]|nr:hypothetical protein [Candidatus Eremiobacteraeota bacterium]